VAGRLEQSRPACSKEDCRIGEGANVAPEVGHKDVPPVLSEGVKYISATPPTCRGECSVDEGASVVPAGMELKVPPSSEVDVSRGDALAFNIKGDALELKCIGRRVASPELSQKCMTRGHRGATAEVSQESLGTEVPQLK
jgi:hypothetical protein